MSQQNMEKPPKTPKKTKLQLAGEAPNQLKITEFFRPPPPGPPPPPPFFKPKFIQISRNNMTFGRNDNVEKRSKLEQAKFNARNSFLRKSRAFQKINGNSIFRKLLDMKQFSPSIYSFVLTTLKL